MEDFISAQAQEAAFWDSVYARDKLDRSALRVEPEDLSDRTIPWLPYLDVDVLTGAMLERVAFEPGARVLDLGCGRGFLSTALALRGARVDAVDVSARSLEIARARAAVSGVEDRIAFHQCGAEKLPFEDGAFDAALGQFVIHHVDPGTAIPELARVLAPGANAGFIETLGFNPVLMLARSGLPGRFGIEKASSDDEAPICRHKLAAIRAVFPGEVGIETPRLVCMRMGVYLRWLNNRPAKAVLASLDAGLGTLSVMRRWSYYGLLILKRAAACHQ